LAAGGCRRAWIGKKPLHDPRFQKFKNFNFMKLSFRSKFILEMEVTTVQERGKEKATGCHLSYRVNIATGSHLRGHV
jgi:hypothetical protein